MTTAPLAVNVAAPGHEGKLDMADPFFRGEMENIIREYVSGGEFRQVVQPHIQGTPVNLITDLPRFPREGDVVYYRPDIGGLWVMVWDGQFWEVSGPPLVHRVQTPQTTTSSWYVNLATTGPTITAPFGGIYVPAFGCTINGPASTEQRADIEIASTAPDSVGHVAAIDLAVAAREYSHSMTHDAVSLLAGEAVTLKYGTSGGTATFSSRWLTLQPLRIYGVS